MRMHTKERRDLTVKGESYRLIRAEYGLHKIGEQSPYFSVTGQAWLKGSRGGSDPDTAGAIHDIIGAAFPKLSDVIALHLSDIDGTPMHARENGWYWFSDYDGKGTHLYPHNEPMYSMTPAQRAEHSLRAPAGHFDGVTTRAEFDARVDALVLWWRAEASAAIARHDLQVFAD